MQLEHKNSNEYFLMCDITVTPQMNLFEIELNTVIAILLHIMIVPLRSAGSIVTVALMNVLLADITSYFTGCGPI